MVQAGFCTPQLNQLPCKPACVGSGPGSSTPCPSRTAGANWGPGLSVLLVAVTLGKALLETPWEGAGKCCGRGGQAASQSTWDPEVSVSSY